MKAAKGRVLSTDTEIREAVKRAREREKTATKIVDVCYDKRVDSVICRLSTGVALTVPRKVIPGFAKVRPAQLTDLAILPGRESIWSDAVDGGVLLEQLLVLTAGESTLGSIGARINASKRTPARAAASRANGAKGGRPRKSAA
jgi:hypothetical protein